VDSDYHQSKESIEASNPSNNLSTPSHTQQQQLRENVEEMGGKFEPLDSRELTFRPLRFNCLRSGPLRERERDLDKRPKEREFDLVAKSRGSKMGEQERLSLSLSLAEACF